MLEDQPGAAAAPELASALGAVQRAVAGLLHTRAAAVEGGTGGGRGGAAEAVGNAATIVWCLAETAGMAAAAAAAERGGGSSSNSSGTGGPPLIDPCVVDAAGAWLLTHTAAHGTAGGGGSGAADDGGGAVGRRVAGASAPFAGPDGVSLVWGLGRLMAATRGSSTSTTSTRSSSDSGGRSRSDGGIGSCNGGSDLGSVDGEAAPREGGAAGKALDALCLVVASDLRASTAGAAWGFESRPPAHGMPARRDSCPPPTSAVGLCQPVRRTSLYRFHPPVLPQEGYQSAVTAVTPGEG